jgi:hypothetical protein
VKRLIKSAIKRAWGLTGVVRRPVRRKLDALFGGMIRDPIAQHLHALNVSHHEMNITLNSCVREIARLEMQVEELRLQLVEERGEVGLAQEPAEAA